MPSSPCLFARGRVKGGFNGASLAVLAPPRYNAAAEVLVGFDEQVKGRAVMDPSQYPQQPAYPGYGQPQTGFAAPAGAPSSVPPKRGSAGRVIAIVAVLVVVLGAVGGFFRYNGPVDTVKGFFQDAFVSFDAHAAGNRVCADAKSDFDEASTQTGLDQVKAAGGTFNLTALQYSVADTNLVSEAHVKIAGKVTFAFQGQTTTVADFSTAKDNVLDVKSSGLGWCLASPKNVTGGSSAQVPGVLALLVA